MRARAVVAPVAASALSPGRQGGRRPFPSEAGRRRRAQAQEYRGANTTGLPAGSYSRNGAAARERRERLAAVKRWHEQDWQARPEAALDDETVSEVMINGPGLAFVERDPGWWRWPPGVDSRSGCAGGRPDRSNTDDHRHPSGRRLAGRRLAGRRLRPASRADGCDHQSPLRRSGIHCRGADRERVASRRRGRRGRYRARPRTKPADLRAARARARRRY